MKKLIPFLAALLTLAPVEAFSAGATFKIPNDVIQYGKSGSGLDKQLVFDFGLGASNPFLSGSSSVLKYSKNQFSLGDGTSSTKQIFANIGGSNPFIKFDASNGDWEFSNDGTNSTPIGTGSGASGIQLLTNPGFESGITLDWSNTGGTFAATSSNPLVGRQSANFTASATGQSFQSGLHAIPLGLQGQACVGSMMYVGGDANLTFEVLDNSSNVLASQVLSASSSASVVNLPFLCPSSGSVQLKVASSASSALLKSDNMFLGQNTLIATSQASYVGGVITPSNCSLNNSATGSYTDGVASSCGGFSLVGQASSFGSGSNGSVTFNNLSPGEYFAVFYGTCDRGNASNNDIFFAATDGSIYGPGQKLGTTVSSTLQMPCVLSGHFSYSTAGSHTFKVQMYGSASDNPAFIMGGAGGGNGESFSLYRYPAAGQQALRGDTAALSWSGEINGADWAVVAPGSFIDPTISGTATLTQFQNRNFGTVSIAGGGTLPGVTFTPPRLGTYQICMGTNIQNNTSGQSTSVRMFETQTSTVLSGGINSYNTQTTPFEFCTHYTPANLTPVDVKMQLFATGGSQGVIAAGASKIQVNIVAIDQQIPAPVIPGSVVTSSQGVEVTERTHISLPSGGPYTVTTQTPGFLTVPNGGTLVSPSTGRVRLTWNPSVFSAEPTCTCSIYYGALGAQGCYVIASGSANIEVQSIATNTGAAFDNVDMGVVCVGPK